MDELFTEIIEKNHTDYPVLSILQGSGTVLRDNSDRRISYDKNNLNNYKLLERGDFIIHLRSFEGGLECSNHVGIVSPIKIISVHIGLFKGNSRLLSQEFVTEKI